jgi:hypothetical protein
MRKPSLASYLLPLAIFVLFTVLALFLGQLSPYPLFWGLCVVFGLAMLVPWLRDRRNWDLRGWLWFAPLVLALDKVIFFPSASWGDFRWLGSIVQGIQELFSNGLIFHVELRSSAGASIGLLFWLPVSAAMSGALRQRSWGWPIFLTLLLLVWLEPLPTASFFFLPLLLLTATVFLLALHLRRRERWERSVNAARICPTFAG